jgi:hypothetical protein
VLRIPVGWFDVPEPFMHARSIASARIVALKRRAGIPALFQVIHPLHL